MDQFSLNDISLEHRNFGETLSNQAVLGALSSLQQKIKRLEQERDYYMNSAQKARQHLEAFKAESESLREQERRQIEEKERQRADDFRKLKEDTPRMQMELHHVHDKALHTERLLEAERKGFQNRLLEVEKERDALRVELLDYKARYTGLEVQCGAESRLHQVSIEEKERSRQNITELLNLNEALFAKVQHLREKVDKNNIVKKRTGRSSSKRRSHSSGVEVHTVCSRNRKSSPKRSTAPLNPVNGNIHERLKRINQGEVPFVPAGKAVHGDSFNQMARVQNGLDISARPEQKQPVIVHKKAPSREPQQGIEEVYGRFAAEYECINKRYADELEKMRHSGDIDAAAVKRMTALSEELVRKGDDLKALRAHESKLQEQLQEATRPALVRGLDKRTKTLELFEEMKRVHALVS
eukprot:TRINITY_DN10647_c0_g1_i1.p1 TRINITY_DN10647_c0_g1~~TRINITY_DN10647_c0_g1_i1.p1  ORF type:complete len:411 (+),score=81.11 TRINITY_DN10647_c0_g1_i1:40-1272(+)